MSEDRKPLVCRWCGVGVYLTADGWAHVDTDLFMCDDHDHGAEPK